MRRTVLMLFAITICLSFCQRGQPKVPAGGDAVSPKTDVLSAKSNNWKVTIVNAAMYTEPRINPNNPSEYLEPPVSGKDDFNLVLELMFEYVGHAGDVAAPTISVTNAKGEKFDIIGNLKISGNEHVEFDVVQWPLSATHPEPPEKHALLGGEKFGAKTPITYYVADIPLASTDLKLSFADIPPIPIRPTQLK